MGSWNPDTPPGIPLQRQVQSAYLCSARLQAALLPLPKCLVGACCVHSAVLDSSLFSSLPLCPLPLAEIADVLGELLKIQETL